MAFGTDIDFEAALGDSILKHCKRQNMEDKAAWLHLLVAAASICPLRERSRITLDLIYDTAEAAEEPLEYPCAVCHGNGYLPDDASWEDTSPCPACVQPGVSS